MRVIMLTLLPFASLAASVAAAEPDRSMLVLSALSPAAFSAAPVDGPEHVLENASIRLVLKDNRIVSLLDKVRLIEHVSPQATSAKGMFSIQLVKGIQPAGELDARDMTARVTRRDANQIDLEFTHPQALVRARIVLAKTPGEIECSLSVTPKSGLLSVALADFPVIETPSADSGGVKRCLLPYREGRLTPLNLPLSDEPKLSFFTYPKHLFAQMIACLGAKGGFLLWTDDQKGHIKEFGRDNDHDDSTFAIKHFFP